MTTVPVALALMLGAAAYGESGPAADQTKEQAKVATASKVADLEMKGDIARARNNLLLAEDYFRQAVRLDPRNSVLYNKLGIAQLKNENMRGAQSSFAKAAKLDPKFAAALNNLGAVACMQKKYSAATKYLKQALALDETNASVHVNLGEAWLGLGQMDRALAEYSRALEIDGDVFAENAQGGVTARLKTPEQRGAAEYLVARMFAKRGNVERALEQLAKAKEDRYPHLKNVYSDQEFAVLWNDPRLQKIVTR